MIKKILVYPSLAFLLLLIAASIYVLYGDKSLRHADIRVENARIRPPLPGQKMGVLYFDLINNGGANQLLSVNVPAAKKTMIHESIDDNGIIKMQHLENVKINAKTTTSFKQGGLHIMLMGLEIQEDITSIPVILTFARPPLPPPTDADKKTKPVYTLETNAKIIR